jgi:hypothetical protein
MNPNKGQSDSQNDSQDKTPELNKGRRPAVPSGIKIKSNVRGGGGGPINGKSRVAAS